MRLRQYDSLRNFLLVAQHTSLAAAAEEFGLTKGALSHQIRRLEEDLGFPLFDRHPRGIRLTAKGQKLLVTARYAFQQIEEKASELNGLTASTLTIGVTTYFASRWLSPHLMNFMRQHPDIRLRIQPMIDLLDFRGEGVDLAIRWGDGRWSDCQIEQLFACPAWPSGNRQAQYRIKEEGLEAAFADFTLLRDREDSDAWSKWYDRAGLPSRQHADTLIIPDPNVRVQAVLDGQGVALNDSLIEQEIINGKLFRLSHFELADYGYFLAYETPATQNPAVSAFIRWIKKVNPGLALHEN